MNPHYFTIAAHKTRSDEGLELLEHLALSAQALRLLEAELPAKINANKVQRGEVVPELSAAQTAELITFTENQKELESELCRDFMNMHSAGEIAWSLHYGLSSDIKQGEKLLDYYHEADKDLAHEVLSQKRKLLDQLTHFLERNPAN